MNLILPVDLVKFKAVAHRPAPMTPEAHNATIPAVPETL